tara:strand:+ start:3967 stop:4380 length:414 start_codon:yes stop_codon:yes gene_type:complete
MDIFGLDGKAYKWNPSRSQASVSEKNRSSLHKKARILLKDLFTYDRILEEVTLPGTKTASRKSILYADFYIPNRDLVIEVHGEQHFKFNSFFYKDKLSFFKAKARDNDKRAWCKLNRITMIELNYNESEGEWRQKFD